MAEDELVARVRESVREMYRLGRELGGGGMSRIFRATDVRVGPEDSPAADQEVVIKVLPTDLAAGISLARFQREIAVAARMQHPNIVPLLSSGDAGGNPWFAMPFVPGESLRERLTSRGSLPLPEAIRVLRDMASALSYAHRQGVVHRDIKPENVLFAGDRAMIADFGVAKALLSAEGQGGAQSGPALTTRRIALGTPTYMSPEQASGDPRVGTRADIYAWGIVAYELLAGQTPFDGRSLHGQLRAHVKEIPVSVSVHRPNAPAALVELVMRSLTKAPAERPQLAESLVEALDAISNASIVQSRQTGEHPKASDAPTPHFPTGFDTAVTEEMPTADTPPRPSGDAAQGGAAPLTPNAAQAAGARIALSPRSHLPAVSLSLGALALLIFFATIARR